MLCVVHTFIGSMLLFINPVAFPSGFIYSKASSKWHKSSVALPSDYLDSQDRGNVERNNRLIYTNTNCARAPEHAFYIVEGEIIRGVSLMLDLIVVSEHSMLFWSTPRDNIGNSSSVALNDLELWSAAVKEFLRIYQDLMSFL